MENIQELLAPRPEGLIKNSYGTLRQLAYYASWSELMNIAAECKKYLQIFKNEDKDKEIDYKKFLDYYEDALMICRALKFQNKKTEAIGLEQWLTLYEQDYFDWLKVEAIKDNKNEEN